MAMCACTRSVSPHEFIVKPGVNAPTKPGDRQRAVEHAVAGHVRQLVAASSTGAGYARLIVVSKPLFGWNTGMRCVYMNACIVDGLSFASVRGE